MQWSARPFIRILLFYLSGLFLAYHIETVRTISPGWILIAIFSLLMIAAFLFYVSKSWQYRWLNGAVLGIAIILAGMFFTIQHFEKMEIDLPTEKRVMIGKIIKQPSVTEQSVKTIIKISEYADSLNVIEKPFSMMAYFSKDSLSSTLKYGDKILFTAIPNLPGGPKNPGEFDYGNFLRRSGVHAIGYVNPDCWEKLEHDPDSKLVDIANTARLSLLNALTENGLNEREFAVAAAVLLGYDDQMDTELEKDYVRAGAMHILCVSGLHVGIVYLVLNFLLGFLRKGRIAIITKTTLLLVFVWAYALLTGMAPSVWRASLMLSLFILGSAINRSRDPYNTLAAAATIMLIIDPMLIFNLGFQLSYTAVLGILIFYKPIYNLLYIKNPLLDKIWSIVVVSTAAQLGTFPLAAHYFHYLPTYFWLTNIVIFPVSFGIIAFGMLFILVAWLPYVPQIIGLALSSLVYVMNYIVGWVKYFPVNGLEGLYFPWIKVVLVYGLIITLYFWLLQRKLRFILPTVLMLFGLIIFQTWHKYEVLNQNQFAVYSINKHNAIDIIKGDQHMMIMDTVLLNDRKKVDYHLKNRLINMGLYTPANLLAENLDSLSVYFDNEFGVYDNFSFMLVNGAKQYFTGIDNVHVDAVIVQGKSKLKLEQLSQSIDFDLLIVDGSVPFWKRKQLRKASDTLGLAFYDVVDSGAYLRDF